MRFAGPPMDLANMRALGVRSIAAVCECGHEGSADVSRLPENLPVPMTGHRLRCSSCGSRPMDVRPDWREYLAKGDGSTQS